MLMKGLMDKGLLPTIHRSYPTELFNMSPYSRRLGVTSTGNYIFSLNVALEALRLVNLGFYKHANSLAGS